MGCDIHIIAEVRELNYPELKNIKGWRYVIAFIFGVKIFKKVAGPWIMNNDKVFKNPYYTTDEELKEIQKTNPKYTLSDWQEKELQSEPPSSRNYDWFAVLADVRNGRGFAGINTGAGFDVISEPKGVPEDACDEWKQSVENMGCDMHSKSYLTLEEFDKFNWNQMTMKYGVIPLSEYIELKDTGDSPNGWSGGISGPNIITITVNDADKIIAGENVKLTGYDRALGIDVTKPASEWKVYVGYEWPVLYSEWFKHNIEGTVEPLRKLKKKHADARLVFGFDN